MSFDVESLTTFAMAAISEFAVEHQDETFYAFCIDANLLCLNSVEQFRITLDRYQNGKFGDSYRSREAIASLRANTGDWEYQGFAAFEDDHGFDNDLYDEHYNIGLEEANDPQLKSTPYATAMDAVISNLVARDAFAPIRRTLDFTVERVEHSY